MAGVENDRELALRAHIRNLLLDYALTHLSVNYVTWTQDAVAELFSESLTFVPAIDPTDPLLPADAHDMLITRLVQKTSQEYDESWAADVQAVKHLKAHLHAGGHRPTLNCWEEDTDKDYERWALQRPMSPVLTTRAIRETPKLGSNATFAKLPHSQIDILRLSGFNSIDIEEEPEQPLPKIEDVLEVKLHMDATTHATVLGLIKTVPAFSGTSADAPPHGVDFLRADSPSPQIMQLDSPPLFPRDRQPGYDPHGLEMGTKGHTSGPTAITDLPSMLPSVDINLDDEDDELYKEHMVVVDGWHAYEVPSSPFTAGTPSLGDGSSEIDELFLASPPDSHKPFIESLMSAKMDEYELPRSEKIGYESTEPRMLGEGQSLATFLSPLIQPSREPQAEARIVTTPKSHPASPRTTVTISMLGQPPSVTEDSSDMLSTGRRAFENLASDGSDWDLDNVVENVCGERLGGEGFHDLILREKLDEKDSLLMDVPLMRSPNDHPPSLLSLPRQLVDLLAPSKSSVGNPSDENNAEHDSLSSYFGCLQKVKGLQSLNIELTWRPFKYGPTIPTDEEVAGVAVNIKDDILTGLDMTDDEVESQLSGLLDEVLHFKIESADLMDNCTSMRGWWDDTGHSTNTIVTLDFDTGYDAIFPRVDHTSAARPVHHDSLSSSDVENERDQARHEDPREGQGRAVKRVKYDTGEDDHDLDCLAQQLLSNDSGVFFASPLVDNSSRAVAFTKMAYDAEGFEGPQTDGDLFPDVDPVHQLDFTLSPSAGQFRYLNMVPASSSANGLQASGGPNFTLGSVAASDNLDDYTADVFSIPLDGPSDDDPVGDLPYFNDDIAMHHAEAHNPANLSGPGITLGEESDPAAMVEAEGSLPGTFIWTSKAPRQVDAISMGLRQESTVISAKESLASFLELVGRRSTGTALPDPSAGSLEFPAEMTSTNDAPIQASTSPSPRVPEELMSSTTLCLPDSNFLSHGLHRYLASIDLIQKRALVRCLQSQQCAVDLVERDHLDDVQLILDPDTAVLFTSLAGLPSQIEVLTASLSQHSWRFLHLLVIFEAYPVSLSYRRESSPRPLPNPFSPTVIKAVKKLRRDLSIADAYYTKRANTTIYFAFATSLEEASVFVRQFGDDAERRDGSGGALWGDRAWLDLEEQDGERDLSRFPGMNTCAAAVILSQVSLDEFLDKTPDERLNYFAHLVGSERLIHFNEELAHRSNVADLPSSSPTSPAED